MSPPKRINARLDGKTAARVATLIEETGLGVSELVKRALNIYFVNNRERRGPASMVLHQSGFVGCTRGDATLSQNYKKVLTDSLRDKHGHR